MTIIVIFGYSRSPYRPASIFRTPRARLFIAIVCQLFFERK